MASQAMGWPVFPPFSQSKCGRRDSPSLARRWSMHALYGLNNTHSSGTYRISWPCDYWCVCYLRVQLQIIVFPIFSHNFLDFIQIKEWVFLSCLQWCDWELQQGDEAIGWKVNVVDAGVIGHIQERRNQMGRAQWGFLRSMWCSSNELLPGLSGPRSSHGSSCAHGLNPLHHSIPKQYKWTASAQAGWRVGYCDSNPWCSSHQRGWLVSDFIKRIISKCSSSCSCKQDTT